MALMEQNHGQITVEVGGGNSYFFEGPIAELLGHEKIAEVRTSDESRSFRLSSDIRLFDRVALRYGSADTDNLRSGIVVSETDENGVCAVDMGNDVDEYHYHSLMILGEAGLTFG